MLIQQLIPQESNLVEELAYREDELRQEQWDRSEEKEEQALDNYYDELVEVEQDYGINW